MPATSWLLNLFLTSSIFNIRELVQVKKKKLSENPGGEGSKLLTDYLKVPR